MFHYIRRLSSFAACLILILMVDMQVKLKIIFTRGRVSNEWCNRAIIGVADVAMRLLHFGKVCAHEILPKRVAWPDTPFILISNHISLLDIPLIFLTCREREMRFIAKTELQYGFPAASTLMRLQNHIFIERSSSKTAVVENIKQLKNGLLFLRKNSGIVIFPEGHRTDDGMVKTFKLGAIKYMQSVKPLPIVYMGIAGTSIIRNLLGYLFISETARFRTQILGCIYPKREAWEKAELAQAVHHIEDTIRNWVEEQKADYFGE